MIYWLIIMLLTIFLLPIKCVFQRTFLWDSVRERSREKCLFGQRYSAKVVFLVIVFHEQKKRHSRLHKVFMVEPQHQFKRKRKWGTSKNP